MVATEYPWPRNSGSRLRLESTLEALAACGPVDLFSAVSRERTDFAPPPDALGLARMTRVAIDDRPPAAADYARALFEPWAPFELPRRDAASVARALDTFAAGPYDLVWYFQVRSWVLAGGPVQAHAVVDIDDLEDRKIEARLALDPGARRRGGQLRRAAARAFTEEDARRWRQLHRRIARRVGATVVCSELDARRSHLRGVRVVPNGYPPPPRPLGRDAVSSPPVVVFQGTLRYPPNADAARYLVTEVGPPLRSLIPDVRIRLVGRTSPAFADLDAPPAVVLAGLVPDIDDELAGADLVVIPVRYGSGTRVKILEAFAHRIPVVSTTVGAEGLDARNGHHLLVADRPEDLARACARLLTDVPLRAAMTTAAHTLYTTTYRSDRVQGGLQTLAREVAAR
ncbi:MAG: glycosyltransferase [Acidimicrobiales bacterium]